MTPQWNATDSEQHMYTSRGTDDMGALEPRCRHVNFEVRGQIITWAPQHKHHYETTHAPLSRCEADRRRYRTLKPSARRHSLWASMAAAHLSSPLIITQSSRVYENLREMARVGREAYFSVKNLWIRCTAIIPVSRQNSRK